MVEATGFSAWESFYVIVGSSAAALTGLQFVVIALVAEMEARSGSGEIAAFGTPTVVHFCVVLLTAAIISSPWPSLRGAAIALVVTGVGGLAYVVVTVRRMARTTAYRAVLEDWIWHVILPVLAYGTIAVSSTLLSRHEPGPLFGVAAAALLLLFIGIHNAWDTVTYIALDMPRRPASTSPASAPVTTPEPGTPA